MSKLKITLDTSMDYFGTHPLHERNTPLVELIPMLSDEQCEECDFKYYGHDHNTNYVKCTVCGHIEEE